MLTFSSQTLSLGNWITRKQEEAAPLAPTPLKMLLSKGKVFLLRADPASKKPTVQKLQNLSPPSPPHPPPPHTVRMAENKERGRGDNNIPFILFEGISKSILFNSILNAVIYLVFNVKNVIIWH